MISSLFCYSERSDLSKYHKEKFQSLLSYEDVFDLICYEIFLPSANQRPLLAFGTSKIMPSA